MKKLRKIRWKTAKSSKNRKNSAVVVEEKQFWRSKIGQPFLGNGQLKNDEQANGGQTAKQIRWIDWREEGRELVVLPQFFGWENSGFGAFWRINKRSETANATAQLQFCRWKKFRPHLLQNDFWRERILAKATLPMGGERVVCGALGLTGLFFFI